MNETELQDTTADCLLDLRWLPRHGGSRGAGGRRRRRHGSRARAVGCERRTPERSVDDGAREADAAPVLQRRIACALPAVPVAGCARGGVGAAAAVGRRAVPAGLDGEVAAGFDEVGAATGGRAERLLGGRCQFRIKGALISADFTQNAPVLGENVMEKRPSDVKYLRQRQKRYQVQQRRWQCRRASQRRRPRGRRSTRRHPGRRPCSRFRARASKRRPCEVFLASALTGLARPQTPSLRV